VRRTQVKFRLQKIAGLSGGGLPIRPPDATGALRKPVVEARGRPPPVADLQTHALSQSTSRILSSGFAHRSQVKAIEAVTLAPEAKT